MSVTEGPDSRYVGIFHYLRFNSKPQRKEGLAVWERNREEAEQSERKQKSRRTKNNTPPHSFSPQPHPLIQREGTGFGFLSGIASTTQAFSYANSAVSVSTVAVLTEGAVVHGPSSLPHHLFKSSKQKPGERATWLVKYACVGPLQWNNDCSITPACARGCVAISCQHWLNVRDVYSWGRERERKEG